VSGDGGSDTCRPETDDHDIGFDIPFVRHRRLVLHRVFLLEGVVALSLQSARPRFD
jgi:hypothetical protein